MTKVIIDGIEYAPVPVPAPEPRGPWVPKYGEEIAAIREDGEVSKVLYGSAWEALYLRGYILRNKEIAEKASPLIGKAGRLIALAFEADPDAGGFGEDRQWGIVSDDNGSWGSRHGASEVPAYVNSPGHAKVWARLADLEGL